MGWHGGWGAGTSWVGWLGMGLMMLVFWGLLAAAVVWVVRSVGAGRTDRIVEVRAGSDALRILDERLARGEVTEDEYTRRRDLLRAR